jgi:hypothetical protein
LTRDGSQLGAAKKPMGRRPSWEKVAHEQVDADGKSSLQLHCFSAAERAVALKIDTSDLPVKFCHGKS